MTRLRRRGATSATILLWVALCLVGFAILAFWTVETRAGPMQADIEKRARAAVVGAPGLDLRVEADGRDVTVHGRVGNEADHRAVIDRLVQVEGVRRIEDALQRVPGLKVAGAAPADEGWGEAAPAEATPAPATTAAASTDAWGTNRPREATATRKAERTQKRRRTAEAAGADRPAAQETTKRTKTRRTQTSGAKATASAKPRGRTRAQGELLFSPGGVGLDATAQAAVRAMAQRARAGGTVHVYGHADDAGSEWANHDLSIDRADRVARALRAAGVPAGRIRAHGAGDQYPLGPAGSLRNRRVELALHGSSQ